MMSRLPSPSLHSLRLARSRNPFSPAASARGVAVVLALAATGCGPEAPDADAPLTSSAGVPDVIGAPAIADPAPGQPGSEERASSFAEASGARVAEKPSVRGDDPEWFFLVRELKQMALGRFWEQDWTEVAQNQADPVPSMVEFRDLLAAKGVDLIIVPIPAKASIYPGKLDARFAPGDPWPLTPLLDRMKEAGLDAIDLEPVMRQRREAQPGEKLWCAQDAHYSPLACEILAELLRRELEKRDWFADLPREPLHRSEPAVLEITGDQVKDSEWDGQAPKETLSVRYAGREVSGRVEPVDPDPASPVLLLGDSHTLVFQEGASGGMHCRGAGLFDQLGYECQFPLDLVGVRGSGLVQARKQLYFAAAPDETYWDKKKAVIWVFSVREFTQSFDKIIPVPIERE